MPNWDEVKKMIREAFTPQERLDAGRALGEHIPPEQQGKTLATMRKGCINVVKLGDLPEAMADNTALYNAVKKVVGGEDGH